MKIRIWIDVYGASPDLVWVYSNCPSYPPSEPTKRYTFEVEVPRTDYAKELHKDNVGSMTEVLDKKGES